MASACFFGMSWDSESAAAMCLSVTVAPAFGAAAFGVFAADLAAAGAFFAAMANDSLLRLGCSRTESRFFRKNKHFLRLGDSAGGVSPGRVCGMLQRQQPRERRIHV